MADGNIIAVHALFEIFFFEDPADDAIIIICSFANRLVIPSGCYTIRVGANRQEGEPAADGIVDGADGAVRGVHGADDIQVFGNRERVTLFLQRIRRGDGLSAVLQAVNQLAQHRGQGRPVDLVNDQNLRSLVIAVLAEGFKHLGLHLVGDRSAVGFHRDAPDKVLIGVGRMELHHPVLPFIGLEHFLGVVMRNRRLVFYLKQFIGRFLTFLQQQLCRDNCRGIGLAGARRPIEDDLLAPAVAEDLKSFFYSINFFCSILVLIIVCHSDCPPVF